MKVNTNPSIDLLSTKPLGPYESLARTFGPKFCEYRKKYAAATSFELETRVPLQLNIEINFSCNLRCSFCPWGNPTWNKPKYDSNLMDFGFFKRIIDEGAEKGLCAVNLALLSEPLLRKDIAKFVSYARDKGIQDVYFNTNAMLLTPEKSRELIEAGLTQLWCSMDTLDPSLYQKLRKGGDLATVLRNIDSFLEMRAKHSMHPNVPLLRVSMVVTSLNCQEKEHFSQYWQEKADFVSIQTMSNQMPENEQSTSLYIPDGRAVKTFHCQTPWERLAVHINGDVFPCCKERGRYAPVGNLHKSSLEGIYTNAECRYLRKIHREGRWREHPVCNDCVKNMGLKVEK